MKRRAVIGDLDYRVGYANSGLQEWRRGPVHEPYPEIDVDFIVRMPDETDAEFIARAYSKL